MASAQINMLIQCLGSSFVMKSKVKSSIQTFGLKGYAKVFDLEDYCLAQLKLKLLNQIVCQGNSNFKKQNDDGYLDIRFQKMLSYEVCDSYRNCLIIEFENPNMIGCGKFSYVCLTNLQRGIINMLKSSIDQNYIDLILLRVCRKLNVKFLGLV